MVFRKYISFEPSMMIINDHFSFLHIYSARMLHLWGKVHKSKKYSLILNHMLEVCVLYLSIISDRVNNGFEEVFTVKIGLIENPSF